MIQDKGFNHLTKFLGRLPPLSVIPPYGVADVTTRQKEWRMLPPAKRSGGCYHPPKGVADVTTSHTEWRMFGGH